MIDEEDMELLYQLREDNRAYEVFIRRLLDPTDLGKGIDGVVMNEARKMLGLPPLRVEV